MSKQKLPVGMDGFEKIRRNGFYYIDKTKLIEQLFLNWGEVNLFTRPRLYFRESGHLRAAYGAVSGYFSFS